MDIDYQKYVTWTTDAAVTFAPKAIMAILTLVIGFWLVKKILIVFQKTLETAKLEVGIARFFHSLADLILKFVVLLVAAGFLGFEVASLVGIIAAASFAIGLALQGSLGNFAAGIIVLVFKPYKIGDWIEVGEKFGKVESIQIFNTTLVTPGLKTMIIPNGKVIDGIVTNFSAKGAIRLELAVTMPYAEDFPKVRDIIIETLLGIPEVYREPLPEVGIETFDTHNIVLTARPFVHPDDYWKVTFEAHRLIKQAFYENSIAVAYSEGIELGKIGK